MLEMARKVAGTEHLRPSPFLQRNRPSSSPNTLPHYGRGDACESECVQEDPIAISDQARGVSMGFVLHSCTSKESLSSHVRSTYSHLFFDAEAENVPVLDHHAMLQASARKRLRAHRSHRLPKPHAAARSAISLPTSLEAAAPVEDPLAASPVIVAVIVGAPVIMSSVPVAEAL